MVTYNTRPSYYVTPQRSIANPRKILPNRFDIYECRDGESYPICSLGAMGLKLNDILKRGIPYEDAKKLFYQIGEMQ